MGKNEVLERTKGFARIVLAICEELDKRKQSVLSSQLLRAGTAIGALIAEAQQAETRTDFIHKMKLAAKEAEETKYWLELIGHINPVEGGTLEELQVILRLLRKIISTAKANLKYEKSIKKQGGREW